MQRTWELAFPDSTTAPRHPATTEPQQTAFPSWEVDETAGNIFTAFTPPVPCQTVSSQQRIPAQGNGRRMLALREELLRAWSAIIDEAAESGTYTQGDVVTQFERRVQVAWAGAGEPLYAVMVNSGTTALYGALVACGIKSGDYVIVPALTFLSTALACSWVGATPIFVDVTPGTWTLSLEAIHHLLVERADLRPHIRAIIPVHLYGLIAPDMPHLLVLARAEGWKVIEDASQAHGATLAVDGIPCYAGTMGDAGCFSLSGVKDVGVAEDGGCLITRSSQMAEFLRMWRDLGRKTGDRYGFHIPGVRARMGKLSAACGLVQFRHLEEWKMRRRQIATRYTEAIGEAKLPLLTPVVPEESEPSWYKYVIVSPTQAGREAIEDALTEANIETEHYYPCILPEQPVYRSGQLPCLPGGDLSVARHLAACGTCLPIYPELTESEEQRVITALTGACAAKQVSHMRKLPVEATA